MITGWAGVYLDVAAVLLIGVLISFASFIIGSALAREGGKDKAKRFESGNEEMGRARGLYVMQYYPYLLVFMIGEPIFVVLFTVLLYLRFISYVIFLIGLVVFTPSLLFALREARVLRKWLIQRD
ncbi:MAG: NADH-quinone oxidoreductase subunit A [Nitrososphaeria archaeon]